MRVPQVPAGFTRSGSHEARMGRGRLAPGCQIARPLPAPPPRGIGPPARGLPTPAKSRFGASKPLNVSEPDDVLTGGGRAKERTTPKLVLNLGDVEVRAVGDDLHQGVLRIAWQRESMASFPERDPNLRSGINRALPGKVPVLVRLPRRLFKRNLGPALRGQVDGRPGLRVTCVDTVFVLHFPAALDDVESDRSIERPIRA